MTRNITTIMIVTAIVLTSACKDEARRAEFVANSKRAAAVLTKKADEAMAAAKAAGVSTWNAKMAKLHASIVSSNAEIVAIEFRKGNSFGRFLKDIPEHSEKALEYIKASNQSVQAAEATSRADSIRSVMEQVIHQYHDSIKAE